MTDDQVNALSTTIFRGCGWITFGLVLVAVAILLSGCAQEIVWNKPGATQESFKVDNYECSRDARYTAQQPTSQIQTTPARSYGGGFSQGLRQAYPGGGTRLAFDQEMYVMCMEARGYQK